MKNSVDISVLYHLQTPLDAIKGSTAIALGRTPTPDPAETRRIFHAIDRQADLRYASYTLMALHTRVHESIRKETADLKRWRRADRDPEINRCDVQRRATSVIAGFINNLWNTDTDLLMELDQAGQEEPTSENSWDQDASAREALGKILAAFTATTADLSPAETEYLANTLARHLALPTTTAVEETEDTGPAHPYPTKMPKLVLDPPYSDIVRRLFLESIAGRTDKDIRVGLHDDGIPSPSGKDWWSPSTIDTILNKPIYAGYVNWGLSSKSGDEPILVPDHHEGIVAPGEFELAHQSRAGRAKTATNPREAGTDRMMSSLLKCRKCKESLQARPTKDSDLCYYICKTRRNETVSVCDCPNIHSREFEPMFLKAVTEDILSPSNTKTIIEVVFRELEVPYEEQLSRLELIEKEILGVEKKEDRVMTAYEAGAYTVENFTKRMDPLRKQKAELNGNKATARKELNRDAVIVASPQMVIDFAKDMSKLIQHSQPKERKELLKRFIQCVWVEPGKATIVYRIPMPSDGANPRATKHELALDGEPVSVWPTARAGHCL